jgi:AraC family transcriptional regulator
MNESSRVQHVPRVYIWDGGWMALGRSRGVVPPHEHHAIQISLAFEGEIRLRTPDSEWCDYRGAIVRADSLHSFDGCSALGAMIFVDPECREGRWLARSLDQTINPVRPARLEECMDRLRGIIDDPPDGPGIAAGVARAVQALCSGPAPHRVLDPRVVRALEIVRATDASRVPLEEVAKALFLSPSRFAHLFTEEVGLPFRRYVLWRKLNRAMTIVRRGSTLSAAAHQSGLSDSAHLTRTFYQMFGVPPTLMIGKAEVYEIPAPFELPGASAS